MVETRYWKVDHEVTSDHPFIQEAAKLIQSGQLVAFPTETVYGLGADARNSEAVQAIYQAKGRPSDNPLIVHIANIDQLDGLIAALPQGARELMQQFWPGPLTLVLPLVEGAVSSIVSAGLSTLAVRMPDHPVALSLIEAAGVPIAAPSANLSGRPSPTRADHVLEDLEGKISGILDGGKANLGLESTVVRIYEDGRWEVLRPGGVSIEELDEIMPMAFSATIESQEAIKDSTPRSPGMKYTHYAPKGDLIVVEGLRTNVQHWIGVQLGQKKEKSEKTGVLAFDSPSSEYRKADHVIVLGSDLRIAAGRLYAALREFDELGIHMIYSEACEETGLGRALMNRLRKASGNRSIRV